MAWNKYYIIVTNQKGLQPDDVRNKLGLNDYTIVGETNFSATNKSGDLFIGNYGDKLIIADHNLTYPFFSEQPTEFEKSFVQAFPNAEIAVLMENSTVGQFGYAIINNGQRVRIKSGCDGEIYIDIGDLLPEEHTILAGQIFEPEELDEMRIDMDEDEVQNMVAFEASWRTPGEISKRYFGDLIDNLDDEAIKLRRYKHA